MRVLVTGGSGRLGREVLRELAERGHEAVNADLQPPEKGGGGAYRQVDLGDVGQVAGAMVGCEAVVHLGAIPAPDEHPAEVVFGNNTRATFAVLQAAALLGVRRAVIASSISALGMAFAVRPFVPLYAPVDEEHPLLPQDPYALSKETDERACVMFHRRTGMSVLACRFHWVADPEEYAAEAARLRDDPASASHQLWGYVDVRDAALACWLGLEAEPSGFEVVNVTAADTLSETPTEELIRRHCPGTEIRRQIPGTRSAFDIEKARRLIGYEPRHTWRKTREA